MLLLIFKYGGFAVLTIVSKLSGIGAETESQRLSLHGIVRILGEADGYGEPLERVFSRFSR